MAINKISNKCIRLKYYLNNAHCNEEARTYNIVWLREITRILFLRHSIFPIKAT